MQDAIIRRIGAISRALDSISNIEFRQYNLTKGQYLYLVRVVENPGIIQEYLAEMIRVDKTTGNRAVNKLETQGLLTKRTNSTNKKNKQLFATDKGLEIYHEIIKEHRYSEAQAVKQLTKDEQQQLLQLLTKVDTEIFENWNQVKRGQKRNY